MRSIITAFVIAGLVLVLTVRVVAPMFPPFVGKADVAKEWDGSWQGKGSLFLDNPDGFVLVTADDRSDIKVHAEIKAFAWERGNDDVIREYVESLMDVTEDEQSVRLTTEPAERPDSLDLLVLYTVHVPRGTALDIRSDNGNVWIREGCGEVSVVGSNSDVRVEKPTGKLSVQTVNGRIEASSLPEGATLKTVNGNVKAAIVSGHLAAETTNGFVHARLLGPTVTGCDLTSQNGGIKVVVSDGCDVDVRARTRQGTIASDIEFDSLAVQNRRNLNGVTGAGTARLTMATLNGDIELVRSE
ncbi:MAG: DUF4097 family beta strand repeat protein [bacterium]|nr:DUF4097 family beta strand repeat protein [bacterium]